MKRRGCTSCRLIEPSPGAWSGGLCPDCSARQRESTPTVKSAPARDPELDSIVARLNQHVRSVTDRYPQAWKQAELFREQRGKNGIRVWPAWCYLPLTGAYAIVTDGRDDVPVTGSDVGVVGALAAWRMTKGIYRFDPTVLKELWDTPVNGDIPSEVLQKMPEWCCYIPLSPPRKVLSDLTDCKGFFVHLEHDQNDGRMELRFLLDYDVGTDPHLTSIPLHMAGTVEQSANAALDEALRQHRKHGARGDKDPALVEAALHALKKYYATDLPPLISLTLYLCSTTAEIVPRKGIKPGLRHGKRGTKLFAAQEPVEWDVAYRLGRTLRAATDTTRGKDQGGTHASPRAHIRRAHWHAFWTGPKAKVGQARETDRKLELKWLPPIPVNADASEVIPTIYPVKAAAS